MKRRVLLALFWTAGVLTLATPLLFISATGVSDGQPALLIRTFPITFLVSFLSLPLISFALKDTDRKFAIVGFTTFFGILLLAIVVMAFQATKSALLCWTSMPI